MCTDEANLLYRCPSARRFAWCYNPILFNTGFSLIGPGMALVMVVDPLDTKFFVPVTRVCAPEPMPLTIGDTYELAASRID